MTYKIPTFLVFFFLFSMSYAQSIQRHVVASAGETISNSNLKLDFTVGETIVGEISNSSLTLNQGFHQTFSPIVLIEKLTRPEIGNNGLNTNSSLFKQNLGLNVISLYPNPTNGIVTIKSLEKLKSIQVTNVNGQRILDYDYNLNSNKLDVSNLNSGVYFINIETLKEQKTIKLVKD